MSGHDKLSQPMKEDVFLCLCAGQRTRSPVFIVLLSLRRQLPASRLSRAAPCPSDTRCSAAASLQEFLVRAGDTKKTAGADGGGLLGCAKVCDNVSAVQLHRSKRQQASLIFNFHRKSK